MNKILLTFLSILIITAFLSVGAYANGDAGSIKGKISAKAKRYRKDSVVYIESAAGDFSPPEEHASMDQLGLVFIPHVLVIMKGGTVDYLNSDDVAHNVFSPDDVADNINLGTWSKEKRIVKPHTFNKLGVAVMLCNVHAEMKAYVVVLQNPYFSKTDKYGNYTIEGVPPGEYTLKVWNEKYKAKDQKVEIKSGKTLLVDFKLKR